MGLSKDPALISRTSPLKKRNPQTQTEEGNSGNKRGNGHQEELRPAKRARILSQMIVTLGLRFIYYDL